MKNNVNLLSYFLSRCLFLGGGLSLIFTSGKRDSYISVVLGIILGVGLMYLYSKILDKINMPIQEYLKKKSFINILIKIVYMAYLLFLTGIELIIISIFIYSYFLPFTPSLVSCLPLIFLACFLNSKSSKNITYVGSVLIVISLVIVFIKTSLLVNEFDFSNILPIFSTKPSGIFKGALMYAILSTAPFFTMAGEKTEFKKSIKYYLLAGAVNFIVLFTINLIMGNMLKVYSYPEYSVLRKIRFFNFIENIENVISMSWIFDVFICLSLCSLKIKNVLNTKKQIVPFLIVAILMIGVHHFVSDNFYNSMFIYKSFIYIFIVFIFLLLILFFIKRKTEKKQHHNV